MFFGNMTGREKLIFISILLGVLFGALGISYWVAGRFASLVMIFFILSLAIITRNLWAAPTGMLKLRIYTIQASLVISGSTWIWGFKLDAILNPFLAASVVKLPFPYNTISLPITSPTTVYSVLIFNLIVMFFVNLFARDRTAMKRHEKKGKTEFPVRNYEERLKDFIELLTSDLKKINQETNWSEQNFISLDAEVEVVHNGVTRKKVTSLLNALRSDQTSKSFLILGDAGAGKSSALRVLALRLLKEVKETKKVPFYINLKDWKIEYDFSKDQLPTPQQLYQSLDQFIKQNLMDRFDYSGVEFIKDFYTPMMDNGRIFLILDSFDEIAPILDVDASSQVIDVLSEAIQILFSGAHTSRGILASRVFRSPTPKFHANCVMAIRSFNETKILSNLRKHLFSETERFSRIMFTERQELLALAMNPFHCTLISRYIRENLKLPDSQSELYSSYIYERLKICEDRLKRRQLTIDQVIESSTRIVVVMFENLQSGLEIPVNTLKQSLPDIDVEAVIDVLVHAKLGRIGGSYEKRFSFVHRRFNEYFISQKLLKDQKAIDLFEFIPTDSRYRDALILYCELTDDANAQAIAELCWQEISHEINNTDNGFSLRAIHCLRFLKEAYRSRHFLLTNFQSKLSAFIYSQIDKNSDILKTKLILEAVGLMEANRVDETIIKSFAKNNHWISETALRACRHLPTTSYELKHRMIQYINSIPMFTFIKNWQLLKFSLSLSHGLKYVLTYGKRRMAETITSTVAIAALFILIYKIALFITIFTLILFTVIKLIALIAEHNVKTSPVQFHFSLFFAFVRGGLLIITISIIFVNDFRLSEISLLPFQTPLAETVGKVVIGILSLFLLPWARCLHYIPYIIKKWNNKFWRAVIIALIGLLVVGSPIMALAIAITKIPPEIAFICKVAGGVISLTLMIGILSRAIYRYLKDWLFFRKIRHIFNSSLIDRTIDRRMIASYFEKFLSTSGRKRFVRALYQNFMIAKGVWPNGKLPNINADEASIQLAKLEERWLGLDRM